MNQEFEPTRKSKTKTALIIFILVLLVTNSISLYLVFQKKSTLDRTATELETRIEKFESLKRYFEAQQKELQVMGINNDSLNQRIESIDGDLKLLKSFRNSSFTLDQQLEYKKKSEELSENLVRQEEALRKTKEQNDSLYKTNTNLRTEKIKLSDSVNSLSFTKKILTEKVTIASAMKAENIRVTAVNARGKERSSDQFRAAVVNKLRITFNLAENPVAEQGNRNIFIRIIKPDGSVAGASGTFKYKNTALPYSASTSVYFAGNRPQGEALYNKKTDYIKGAYKTEFYCEGFKIGEGSFVIR